MYWVAEGGGCGSILWVCLWMSTICCFLLFFFQYLAKVRTYLIQIQNRHKHKTLSYCKTYRWCHLQVHNGMAVYCLSFMNTTWPTLNWQTTEKLTSYLTSSVALTGSAKSTAYTTETYDQKEYIFACCGNTLPVWCRLKMCHYVLLTKFHFQREQGEQFLRS